MVKRNYTTTMLKICLIFSMINSTFFKLNFVIITQIKNSPLLSPTPTGFPTHLALVGLDKGLKVL